MPRHHHPRPPAAPTGIGRRARLIVSIALSFGLLLVGVGASDAGSMRWAADPPRVPSANASGAPDAPSAVASGAPQAAASGADSGARASGLPWSSGVFSHDAVRTVEFDKARGRTSDVLVVFPTRDSWESVLDDWWMSPSAVPEGFKGTLAVGVPLFPDDGSMEVAARGDDDARWTELGRLIASRYPDAWVRPGWEMNIPNWPWSAHPENVESYKQAFRRASIALKAGGPNLRVVFNPNEGRGQSLPDARLAYPGDDVVDSIGIDAYDWYPSYAGAGWQEHRTKDQGWDFWMQFARDHGKTFAVPEWGVMTGSEASGGDNPEYIEAVLGWMAKHADTMAFDAYFEEPADYCRCALGMNPRAQQAYTQALERIATASRVAQPATPGVGVETSRTATPGGDAPEATATATATATPETDDRDVPVEPSAAGEDGTAPSATTDLASARSPGRGRYGRDVSNRVLRVGIDRGQAKSTRSQAATTEFSVSERQRVEPSNAPTVPVASPTPAVTGH